MLNETANLKTLELGYHLINNQMIVQLKKKVLLYFLMGWNIAPIEYEDLPYTVFPLKVSSIKPLAQNNWCSQLLSIPIIGRVFKKEKS
ncbi:hypothetical protein QSV37_16460 [Acinetobacter sp. VNK23]|nr:hypothetical protein [Acinetobacter thutiue]